MRAASEDTRYGFAIGRVRALEARLFDRQQWDRLVRARDAEEFRSLFAETDYARGAQQDAGAAGAQETGALLAAASAENFAFLARYCEDEWVLDLFRLLADVHNLKVTAKAALAGRELPGTALLDYGRWDADQLAALAGAQRGAKPERFRAAVAEARNRWESGPVPAFLDAVLDRAGRAEVAAAVRDNEFLAGYFDLAADVQNLRALVRVKLLGENRDAVLEAMLPGGSIAPRRLAGLLGEDWAAVAAAFRLTRYGPMMEQGIAGLVNSGSLLRFERLGRELELDWLSRARYMTFGFEPLVGYYLFRENEIANLRRLAVAKSAGLGEADCAELVAHA
ncbi:MAG: V-type ATPase subunit [bacterium]